MKYMKQLKKNLISSRETLKPLVLPESPSPPRARVIWSNHVDNHIIFPNRVDLFVVIYTSFIVVSLLTVDLVCIMSFLLVSLSSPVDGSMCTRNGCVFRL